VPTDGPNVLASSTVVPQPIFTLRLQAPPCSWPKLQQQNNSIAGVPAPGKDRVLSVLLPSETVAGPISASYRLIHPSQ